MLYVEVWSGCCTHTHNTLHHECAHNTLHIAHIHVTHRHIVVGRGPPFAYWRKVGLQAYTWICYAATGIAVQSDCSVQVGPLSLN